MPGSHLHASLGVADRLHGVDDELEKNPADRLRADGDARGVGREVELRSTRSGSTARSRGSAPRTSAERSSGPALLLRALCSGAELVDQVGRGARRPEKRVRPLAQESLVAHFPLEDPGIAQDGSVQVLEIVQQEALVVAGIPRERRRGAGGRRPSSLDRVADRPAQEPRMQIVLHEVLVRACLEYARRDVRIVRSREDHHGHVVVALAKLRDGCRSVAVGELQIDEQDVDPGAAQVHDPFRERRRVLHVEALAGCALAVQAALHDERIADLVFDQEHLGRGGLPFTAVLGPAVAAQTTIEARCDGCDSGHGMSRVERGFVLTHVRRHALGVVYSVPTAWIGTLRVEAPCCDPEGAFARRRSWLSRAVYLAAGKLGLSLALVHASASAVWPPTGIALAAFLLLGRSAWPAIFAGAFLVNVTTAGNPATSLGIAVGNTLEGIAGAELVGRFAGGTAAFDRPRDVFKFFALAGLVATAISPSIGVTSLCLGGFARWSEYARLWLTWWLGDAGGAVVVAPALVLWANRPWPGWTRAQQLEAAGLLATLAAVGTIAFGLFLAPPSGDQSLKFLCLPPTIWAAFRFGRRETATAVLILSGIAVWGTVRGTARFPEQRERVAAAATALHGRRLGDFARAGLGRLATTARDGGARAAGGRARAIERRARRVRPRGVARSQGSAAGDLVPGGVDRRRLQGRTALRVTRASLAPR